MHWAVLLAAVECIPSPATRLDFLAIGDWGSDSAGQKRLATTLNTYAKNSSSSFLIALGDNFYEFGVSSTTDKKWTDVWKNVYTDYLQRIPWYTVLGNHDWYGNVKAQIDFTQVEKNWVLPEFFYTREETVAGKKVGFIYIDTDLFNYGYNCLGFECALINFKKQGWTRENNTMEKQFEWIEAQLKAFQNHDYVFVSGHHNIAMCNPKGDMPRLGALLERYNVSGYLFGHHHNFGYKKVQNTMYLLTGAAGKTSGGCGDRDIWKDGNKFGFAHVSVGATDFSVRFVDEQGRLLYQQTGTPRPKQ
jgi:predicted phosphodiesterase